MNITSTQFAAFLLTLAIGCDVSDVASTVTVADQEALHVVSGSQLNAYVRKSASPLLVEFGVDLNCPRCAQTKSDVLQLSETLDGVVDVIRVDFNANVQRVTQLGGTICPTYVLFDKGEPVLTRSFPVSIDLIEGEILRIVGDS